MIARMGWVFLAEFDEPIVRLFILRGRLVAKLRSGKAMLVMEGK